MPVRPLTKPNQRGRRGAIRMAVGPFRVGFETPFGLNLIGPAGFARAGGSFPWAGVSQRTHTICNIHETREWTVHPMLTTHAQILHAVQRCRIDYCVAIRLKLRTSRGGLPMLPLRLNRLTIRPRTGPTSVLAGGPPRVPGCHPLRAARDKGAQDRVPASRASGCGPTADRGSSGPQ
jgi:hypothetical protein